MSLGNIANNTYPSNSTYDILYYLRITCNELAN